MRWSRLRRFVVRLLRLELRRPRAQIAFALLAVSGCVSPMTPRAKLDEHVHEMNTAARFGRHDLAAERVAPEARASFAARHRAWGTEVRIVDLEYGGVERVSEEEAVILVAFNWYRPAEGLLRTTTVRQTWRNDKGTGPWFLVAEQRAAGDVGLLGEATTVLRPERPDVRFETTIIR
jgi:hypothetical protein